MMRNLEIERLCLAGISLGIAGSATFGLALPYGLRVLQRDALDQHDVAVGVQRSFAETVDAYIERKLAEE